jgi:hypothetical protein
MKFTRNRRDRRDRGLIRLNKGKNLISQWYFRCPCGLSIGGDGSWLASPPLRTRIYISQHRQSLKSSFLIVYYAYNFQILVCGNSRSKLFMKLSHGPRRISMSD